MLSCIKIPSLLKRVAIYRTL